MVSTEIFREARDLLLLQRQDYASAYANFAWPELDKFNWALDWFDAELATGTRKDEIALRIVGEDAAVRSFADLSQASNRVAEGLRNLGVRRGDRILLMVGNCVALWETMLAAMKLGAIVIPATTLLTPEDVRDRVVQARVTHIVTASDLVDRFALLDPTIVQIATGSAPDGWHRFEALYAAAGTFVPDGPSAADDPILMYFTSGTTARPKLVVHSHRSYGVGHLSTMYWLGLQPGDLHMNVSSPGWAKHAWSCFFAPWNAGAGVFILNQGRFNAQGLLRALTDNNVTSLCAPPTVWRMLVQEDIASFDVALTSACAAGEPLNPEVIGTVERAWGLTIRDGFGQTETSAQIANSPGQEVSAGSVGRPLPGYDIALLDADGNEVDEGEISLRLSNRPAGLMQGYLVDTGTIIGQDGAFYRTGDVASRDRDGSYTYIGRADDVFKASDYRISPFELESALIEHPAVMEAAVVPAPDALRTAVPKAFIALAPGHMPGADIALEIFRHIRTVLAPYKRIRRIEFGELPKTISGKIRRIELRRLEIERSLSSGLPDDEFREEQFAELLNTKATDNSSR